MVRLVVFLGNPGARYANGRHNVARMLIPHLPFASQLHWTAKFNAQLAEYRPRPEHAVRLLQAEQYMNRNGISVARAAQFYRLTSEEILVVHDDLELPFGRVGLRTGGGLGGHNGLRSVRQQLGSAEFRRLRIGIGRPARGSVDRYVLSRFSHEEEAELPAVLAEAAAELVQAIDA